MVSLDVLDHPTLETAGEWIWRERGKGLFTAASSGLQDALAAHWRARGWLPETASLPRAEPVDRIAVVSGSCSPVTAARIAWARANGFDTERLRLAPLLQGDGEPEIARVVDAAEAILRRGHSPLIHSAEGPDDPAVTGFDALAHAAGLAREAAARRIGEALGEVMRRLLERAPLTRVVVAGGACSTVSTPATPRAIRGRQGGWRTNNRRTPAARIGGDACACVLRFPRIDIHREGTRDDRHDHPR